VPEPWTVRELPPAVKRSPVPLWGLWTGTDWATWPGETRGVQWFVAEYLALEATTERNGRHGLLVAEQSPGGDAEAAGDAVGLVDADGVAPVLGSADGSVVDANPLG